MFRSQLVSVASFRPLVCIKCRYDTLNVNILAARAKTAYKTEHLNVCISKSIQSCNLRFVMLIILPLKVM